MNRKSGFTLIELLVVIAIIGILAAIIFPVFARAKAGAYRSSDITNMNSLRTALQLYRADNGAYPPALLGYVNTYSGDPLGTDVIPAEQLRGALYAKRVEAIKTFTPAYERAKNDATTFAVWPNGDERAVGAAPVGDLNGDGAVNGLDDTSASRQAYNPTSGYVARTGTLVTNNTGDPNISRFYNVSGYDTAEVRDPVNGGTRRELRYTLFWTRMAILNNGGVEDDPRQLGYTDPPENTVITWNSYYRDYNGNLVQRNKNDIVLFLGGAARPFDSLDVSNRSWRVTP